MHLMSPTTPILMLATASPLITADFFALAEHCHPAYPSAGDIKEGIATPLGPKQMRDSFSQERIAEIVSLASCHRSERPVLWHKITEAGYPSPHESLPILHPFFRQGLLHLSFGRINSYGSVKVGTQELRGTIFYMVQNAFIQEASTEQLMEQFFNCLVEATMSWGEAVFYSTVDQEQTLTAPWEAVAKLESMIHSRTHELEMLRENPDPEWTQSCLAYLKQYSEQLRAMGLTFRSKQLSQLITDYSNGSE